ncbi:hypothetical protein PP707_01245 [Acetobacter pasteurianus]|nr:hypothetical protein [Acetobacter pasteurianus]
MIKIRKRTTISFIPTSAMATETTIMMRNLNWETRAVAGKLELELELESDIEPN